MSNDTEQWQLLADWMIYFNPLELSKHPLDEEGEKHMYMENSSGAKKTNNFGPHLICIKINAFNIYLDIKMLAVKL